MYSPGSLKVAVVVALPLASFASAVENCTAPGPLNFVQKTVMPDRRAAPRGQAVVGRGDGERGAVRRTEFARRRP